MFLRSDLISAIPGVVHGFTTAEAEEFGDLSRGAPERAWRALAAALGAPEAPVARASQVHSAVVLEVRAGGLAGEGDALISDVPGLLLAVRVADCVPVLVAGPGVVAAIHAGWRGLAGGVIPSALAALRVLAPAVAPEALVAAVGPCISAARYEVGAEVIDGIASAGVPREVFVRPGPRRDHADLRAAAAWQLAAGGLSRVDVLPHCTYDDPRLHSHRRDGAASGRLAGVVGLRG